MKFFHVINPVHSLVCFLHINVELFFTRFLVLEKRRSSIELSNNIIERPHELKANEPVSERSERASQYIVGYMSKLIDSEI